MTIEKLIQDGFFTKDSYQLAAHLLTLENRETLNHKNVLRLGSLIDHRIYEITKSSPTHINVIVLPITNYDADSLANYSETELIQILKVDSVVMASELIDVVPEILKPRRFFHWFNLRK